jgi:hypothetical protein
MIEIADDFSAELHLCCIPPERDVTREEIRRSSCGNDTRPNAWENVPAPYEGSSIMILVFTQFGRVHLYIDRRERRVAADHVGSPFGNHNDRRIDVTADEIWHH